jgi:hypothetical protein
MKRGFCKNGHDAIIVGRDQWGHCRACRSDRFSRRFKPKRPKRAWTPEEDARLLAHTGKLQDLSVALDRTEDSISKRRTWLRQQQQLADVVPGRIDAVPERTAGGKMRNPLFARPLWFQDDAAAMARRGR